MEDAQLRSDAEAIFSAALRAVDPEICMQRHVHMGPDGLHIGNRHVPLSEKGNVVVLGFGKASAAMAKAVQAALPGRISRGLVVTKYGHAVPVPGVRILEAGHPVPDTNGADAATTLLEVAASVGPGDVVLCLISGGGSALIPAPAPGISLEDKQAATKLLLESGADIQEVNTIRKHLSRIKGGQLCRALHGATVVSLIISDVIGDDPASIASGPTAPDPGTFAQCLEIISRYRLHDRLPPAVNEHLSKGSRGLITETPKPGDPLFDAVHNMVVGSLEEALSAAAVEAGRKGYHPLVLTSMLRGEAREAAKFLSSVALEVRRSNRPVPVPACLLSGGETTVRVRGNGRGGRNMELALAAGIELAGVHGIVFLSAGTDGTDGPTDAAGAFVDGSSTARADALGLSPTRYLADNDSYTFFRQMGDLLVTGPTRTNVMDLQIGLIAGEVRPEPPAPCRTKR